MKRSLSLVAALSAFSFSATAAQAEDVFGLWLVESGKAIVDIQPCGAKACGKIVWLQEPNDAQGAPKLDFRNEDPALQSRGICGMDMVGGFEKDAPGEWNRGWIYNPEEGETYTAFLEMQSDGSLKLRGYVGLPIFGRTQIWRRAPDHRGGC